MGLIIQYMVYCPRLSYDVNVEEECETCPWQGYMDAVEYHCSYEEDTEGMSEEEIAVMVEEYDRFGY